MIVGGAVALLGASSAAASAADATVVQGLVRNAWYWQARAREDKVAEAWKSVLAADPDQSEALAALGGLDARAGRMQQARDALARLEKVAPGHPDSPVLRRQIELGPRFAAMLAAARKLVHQGHVEEGAARYREIFTGHGPPGDLALEYFDTIGGTRGGWAEARDGLQRLVTRVPGEARFKLALAKLLTYRAGKRREGIAMLEDLSRDATVSKEATASWRKALLWLGASPEDAPQLGAYLKSHPGDAAIARVLQRSQRAGAVAGGFTALDRGDTAAAAQRFAAAGDDPKARRGLAIVRQREASENRKAGFAALDRGDVAEAERRFRDAGNDPNARLGLAVVAQRQAAEAQRDRDYSRARSLLDRARTLAPQRPDIWEPALRSLEFWTLLDEGRLERQRGRADVAERKFREARDRAPSQERWNAELALADLYLARGDRDRAGALYRRVLEGRPQQPEALWGRTATLVQLGRFEEAILSNEALLKAAPDKAFRSAWLRAEARRSRAAHSRAAHDLGSARADLEAARREDPTDSWVLHDLADLLLERGDTAAARPVVVALLQAAPQMPEARIVEARLLAAQGENARALEALSAVPKSRMDPGLAALRRRLEVQAHVPAMAARARAGARTAVLSELLALQRDVEDEPQLAGAIAVAWSQIGEPGKAIALIRRTIARWPRAAQAMPGTRAALRSIAAGVELASPLLDADRDPATSALLVALDRVPDLTPDEKRWLADLRIWHAVRVADRERTAGDTAAASAALAPVRRDYPRDPRVLTAQARILEPKQAVRARETYVQALAVAPEDFDARRGAVDTALVLGERRVARGLAAEGVRRAPRDARMHLLAARVAAQSGDDPGAMRALERAQALADDPAPPTASSGTPPATALERAPRPQTPPGASGATPETRAEIGRETERVRERHRSGIEGMGEVRIREGERGLNALTELRQTATAEVAVGYWGRAMFRASEVELDAGTLAGSASARFGDGTDATGPQRATGTALSVGYEGRDLAAEVGASAFGFPVRSLVGALRLRHVFGPVRVALEGARRNVTDSLLSYAGARDAASGQVWGGVVMQGGRLDLGLERSRSRYYAHGSYDWLTGDQVAANRRVTAGAGAEASLSSDRSGSLTVGVDALGMHYEQNLSRFTIGHGGYFSPQRFARVSIPVGWRSEGPLRWELVAAPGYEWFEESQVPVFPLDGTLEGTALYASQRVSGFALDAHAMLGWSFARGFEVRTTAAVQRAHEYQEFRAGLLLRYGSVP